MSYDKHLEVATKLAIEAGKIIKAAWNKPREIQFKAPTDLVTETDKACENLIVEGIKKEFPDHSFVAEEAISEGRAKEELTDAPTWIIDPLDGTINFVHKIPFCAVSVGFAVKKEMVVGVIYNPIIEELFTAQKDKGARLNGEIIRVSETSKLKESLVATACAGDPTNEDKEIYNKVMNIVFSNCRSFRRCGSAALDLAYVASGRIDIYCEKGIHVWDISAGIIIVKESGGCISNLIKNKEKEEYDPCSRQIVASNKILIKLFIDKLNE